MTLLHTASDFKKMDTRVIERNLQKGAVDPKAVEKALAALPDDSANAEWSSIEALAAEEGDTSR